MTYQDEMEETERRFLAAGEDEQLRLIADQELGKLRIGMIMYLLAFLAREIIKIRKETPNPA
jgi:hypothetical protein